MAGAKRVSVADLREGKNFQSEYFLSSLGLVCLY